MYAFIFNGVCVGFLPVYHNIVEVSIRLDVFLTRHISSFSADVKVPVQPLPLQRQAHELRTGLQTPDGQK